MIFINFVRIAIIMVAMPLSLGYIIFRLCKVNKKDIISTIGYIFFLGQITMWALFQLISVPLIIAKSTLTSVTVIWLCSIAAILIMGFLYVHKMKSENNVNMQGITNKSLQSEICYIVMLVLATMIIGYQCYKYIFCMHIDNDDSRFVVNAVDAYEYGTMFLTNPASGCYMGTWVGELTKDVSSPWSIYMAMVGRLIGVYPTILAHTVYPPFLLIMGYIAYYLIGREIFEEKIKAVMFVIVVAALNMSFGQSVYNQSYFTIVRIWQGKAIVAGVLIPFLMYLLLKLYKTECNIWEYITIVMTSMSMCLMSGMGIFFSGIMVGTMGLWFTAIKKMWKKIPYIILGCVPTIIYGLSYVFVK